MIAVDTSALIAILLDEPEAEACMTAIADADGMVMSAATLAEAGIVSARRGFGNEMAGLIDRLRPEIATVSPAMAARAVRAHQRWGKGVHAAALNFGDCFSYAIAEERDCPLLFVGEDFARADLRPAM